MMSESLMSAALRYAQLGYAVFPCAPGRKVPMVTNGRNAATTDVAQIEAWWQAAPRANIGISTDDLIVIDIDGSDNGWPHDGELGAQLASAATSMTPRGGRHHVYRQPEGKAWRSSAGRLADSVDTRGWGGYICAEPSVLPGGAYRWVPGCELDLPRAQLPVPPPWLADLLDGLAAGRISRAVSAVAGDGDANPLPEGSRNEALARLAGSMRRVGMSRAEITAALRQINRDRCQPPLDEQEVDDIARKIARYEPDQTWVAFAEDHAAQDAAESAAVEPSVPGDPGPMPDHLLHVPGIIGDVMRYIDSISHRPQPVLALGASICLMSVLCGRKVRDAHGSRPNVYVIGVAPSGAGKEAARQAIKTILAECGGIHLLGEGIASHTGLVNALVSQPSRLYAIDEIGRWLRSISGAVSAPHLAGIITVLMRLYSSAGNVFVGEDYADVTKRSEISQPNCVLYGTTVPGNLFAGLTSESITDGFLSRMLLFESSQVRKRKVRPSDVPADLVERCKRWVTFTGHITAGNLNYLAPKPLVVPTTDDAAALLDSFDTICDDQMEAETHDVGSLWTRASEKAHKLALLYACSRAEHSRELVIDGEAASWGAGLSQYLTARLVWLARSWVADGAFDAKRLRVLRALRRAGTRGMLRSELTRATQALRPAERDEILNSLVTSHEVELVQGEVGTNGKRPTRYICRGS